MIIVGIDEVGRGCWAGPVVSGAVILGEPIEGLKDSKKLSKKRREELTKEIHDKAVAVGIGWVDAETLDRVGITLAVKMSMELALQQIEVVYDKVIIDGHINFLEDYPKTECLIKADDLIPAVSAASIVAKVARDNFMADMDKKHPGYGFEAHVGYGTAAHVQALQEKGICDLHRKSFKPIKAMVS